MMLQNNMIIYTYTRISYFVMVQSSQLYPQVMLFLHLYPQVMLFLQRVQGDFDKTPAPMRKALSYRDALSKHQCCAMFLHLLSRLQRMCPPSDFKAAADNLRQQFCQGFMDPDLLHAAEQQVPPGDLEAIAAFRPFVSQIENATKLAKEKQDEELATSLREADFRQVITKLESDLRTLEDRKPNSEMEAIKNAKDMKYLRDRQKNLLFINFLQHFEIIV